MFDDSETATAGKRQRSRRFCFYLYDADRRRGSVVWGWVQRAGGRGANGGDGWLPLPGVGRALPQRLRRGVGAARGRRDARIVVQCYDFAEPWRLGRWTEDAAARRVMLGSVVVAAWWRSKGHIDA